MNLLNKLTIKNLKLNKKRTIVTIIGIMLSVALITAVSSIYLSGLHSIIDYEILEKGNYHIGFNNVPINEMATIKNNRGVEEVYLTQDIGYFKIHSQNEYKPYGFIKAFTLDSLDNLAIQLTSGRMPENNKEIIVPTHLKTNGRVDLKVGDVLQVDVGQRLDNSGQKLSPSTPYIPGGEEIKNTQSQTYTIVGTYKRLPGEMESYDAPGYTFVTYLAKDNITGVVDAFVLLNKKGLKDRDQIISNILGIPLKTWQMASCSDDDCPKNMSEEEQNQAITDMAHTKYPLITNGYLISLETDPLNSSGLGELGYAVIVVIGIIIFTSVFCIKNSFDISITEKIRQYGMLRSIGATKKQIKHNVLYEGFILGLIGIPLGIIIGLLATFILTIVINIFMTDMLSDGLRFTCHVSFMAIILAIVLGFLTIYFSTLRSARKASKISPIESIRNSGNIKLNSKRLKGGKLIKKIFGIGGEISYKNLKRNKKKYRTTIISIAISSAVFIALSSFMQYAFLSIDNELNLYDYNLSLSINDAKNYPLASRSVEFEEVQNYTIYQKQPLPVINPSYNPEYKKLRVNDFDFNSERDINVITIGNYQYQKYLETLGLKEETLQNKAILIDNIKFQVTNKDKKLEDYQKREFTYQKGDMINLINNDNTLSLEIGYVSKKLPFGLKEANYQSLLVVSDTFFEENFDSNEFIIYYRADNPDKLQDKIDVLLKGTDYYLNNINELAELMKNLYTLIGIFLYGFIIVITLIGVTNIFNTITTSMELRRQEFAMLKSVGMTSGEFKRMIRLESLFVGTKSLLFGIPIGLCLSYLIYHFLVGENMMKYILPYKALLICVLAVFILIILIMKYSLSRINKQNIIETIRNENI